ncbi:MAG: glycosyltransferase family 4 protein [Verrucomicrobiales bacterium]|nr:glycosyltransferase family 4 protein [Verrucomicrobiales bacterium]
MGPRIAIACSGLGNIRRGNETWARDASAALHRAGASVTLIGGGPEPEAACPYVRLPNLHREFPLLRRWWPWSRRYLLEQLSFLFPLRRYLRVHGFQAVHLCDPDLALQLHRRQGAHRIPIVFKDGMCLGPHWCSRIPFVQVLAPHYRDVLAREAGVSTEGWFVIPHMVDPAEFVPPPDRALPRAARPDLSLPPNAFVIMGVGDFSAGGNKRLDWLVRETARLPAELNAHLVLAGQAAASDFAAFQQSARTALGDRVRLLRNLPRREVARLYQVADVYAHAATREPFGIVFLEAMASGLPILGHTWDVTRWIIGDAGIALDMTAPGALATHLEELARHPDRRADLGVVARRRVLARFSPDALIPQYLELYRCMTGPNSFTPLASRSDPLP